MSGTTSSAKMNDLLQHVLSADEKQKRRSSYTLTQSSFAGYFESKALPAAQRFEDLQTFNRSIDVENLVRLLAFWQIFKIKDMHGGNILWTVNPQGGFSVIGIDYNLCFEYTDQLPPLSMLQQATQPIAPALKGSIEAISHRRLSQVFGNYKVAMPECLSQKSLDAVKGVFQGQTTIRGIMHAFYKMGEIQPISPRKKMSEFYAEAGPGLTAYHPLEIRPVGKSDPGCPFKKPDMPRLTGYKSILVEKVYGQGTYTSYQVRHLYDWVFCAQNSKDLEKGRFFNSSDFPAYYIWRRGMIPSHLMFGDDYLKILPSA